MTKFPSDAKGNEVSKALALTGSLQIGEEAYDGNESFTIYNRYAQDDVYPNLDIYFEGETAHLHSIKIYNGNDELYWFRKTTTGSDVDATFLSDGPMGAYDLNKIIKSSTESTDFVFTKTWEVYDNEGNKLATIGSSSD